MVAWRSKFDGQTIETPIELRGSAPGEVLIIYAPAGQPPNSPLTPPDAGSNPKSIWDAFGKSPAPRTATEIIDQVRAERDSWGER